MFAIASLALHSVFTLYGMGQALGKKQMSLVYVELADQLFQDLMVKYWAADQTSKKADLPLQGELPDSIKNFTGQKSTLHPQSKKGKEPRRKRSPSFSMQK